MTDTTANSAVTTAPATDSSEAVVAREAAYRQQRYEAYTKERQSLDANLLALSDRYSKALLALAGGSLGLTITFLEKIAPHPPGWTIVFLIGGWAFLLACIVVELIAMHAGQDAILASQNNNQAAYQYYLASLAADGQAIEPLMDDGRTKALSTKVLRLSVWGLRTLVLGLVLLCAFSVVNICLMTGGASASAKPIVDRTVQPIAPIQTVTPADPPPAISPPVVPTAGSPPAQPQPQGEHHP